MLLGERTICRHSTPSRHRSKCHRRRSRRRRGSWTTSTRPHIPRARRQRPPRGATPSNCETSLRFPFSNSSWTRRGRSKTSENTAQQTNLRVADVEDRILKAPCGLALRRCRSRAVAPWGGGKSFGEGGRCPLRRRARTARHRTPRARQCEASGLSAREFASRDGLRAERLYTGSGNCVRVRRWRLRECHSLPSPCSRRPRT
jgi:hypothetical protein